MFTGLIEEMGTIGDRVRRGAGAELSVECPGFIEKISAGDSVAVDGVCLTARELTGGGFLADLSPETTARSTLVSLPTGSNVNLELPLEAGGRLGGHFVQGHVDGLGKLLSKRRAGSGWTFEFSLPPDLSPYAVEKGSIAINGVSLTIAALEHLSFEVAVIPHTYRVTNLQHLKPGADVNLEADILAKYIVGMLRKPKPSGGITEEFLAEHGFGPATGA